MYRYGHVCLLLALYMASGTFAIVNCIARYNDKFFILANSYKPAGMIFISKDGLTTYSFAVCGQAVDMTDNSGCNDDFGVCIKQTQLDGTVVTTSVANISKNVWTNDTLELVYSGPNSEKVTLDFKCDLNAPVVGEITSVVQRSDFGSLSAQINTPCACAAPPVEYDCTPVPQFEYIKGPDKHIPKPTSFGSMLNIIITVVAILYYTGGFVVKTVAYGKRGLDAIPNSRLWLSLPSLVVDGTLYIREKLPFCNVNYESYKIGSRPYTTLAKSTAVASSGTYYDTM